MSFRLTPASGSEQPVLCAMVKELFAEVPELAERCGEFSADRGYDQEGLKEDLWEDYAIRPLIDTRLLWREEKQDPDYDPSKPILRLLDRNRADNMDSLWEYSLHSARQCQGAMNDGMDSAAACILSDGVDSLFDKGIGLADEQGKGTFGENFSISGRMTWSPDVGSTGGLDMVTPFSFAGSGDLASVRSASFMQQGITRWRDGFGAMRNDLRHGVVHRFRVGNKPDSDVVGLSSFYLHSAEHGHEVLALGLDYFGRWGTGEFRYI